ncbi:MAG: hypothetical protein M3292_10900 [Actinomycetota bacterium]|nr:hypothetical protein [Actinomycetota bacterium]
MTLSARMEAAGRIARSARRISRAEVLLASSSSPFAVHCDATERAGSSTVGINGGLSGRKAALAVLAVTALAVGFGSGNARAADRSLGGDVSSAIQAEVNREIAGAQKLADPPRHVARSTGSGRADVTHDMADAIEAPVAAGVSQAAEAATAAATNNPSGSAPRKSRPARRSAGVSRSTSDSVEAAVEGIAASVERAVDAGSVERAVDKTLADVTTPLLGERATSLETDAARTAGRAIVPAVVERDQNERRGPHVSQPPQVGPSLYVLQRQEWIGGDPVPAAGLQAPSDTHPTSARENHGGRGEGPRSMPTVPPRPFAPDRDTSFASGSAVLSAVMPPLLVALAAIFIAFAITMPGRRIRLPASRVPRGAVLRPWRPG